MSCLFWIFRILDESPRWLISNGRFKEAKAIFKKAARWNKVNPSSVDNVFSSTVDVFTEKLCLEKEYISNGKLSQSHDAEEPINGGDKHSSKNGLNGEKHKTPDKKSVQKYTVLDILKNPALRTNTFILWYTW